MRSFNNEKIIEGFVLARGAGESIETGVERSETPGSHAYHFRAHETGDSGNITHRLPAISKPAVAHFVGLAFFSVMILGFRYRSTPGFMLTPATRVGVICFYHWSEAPLASANT
jgi:hypothetical protein